MQQTETYKLNLIESTDTFSPQPINENMEAIEGVLQALHSTIPKIEIGTYNGSGTVGASAPNSLTFSFAPCFILIWGGTHFDLAMGTQGNPLFWCRNNNGGAHTLIATWTENSVAWYYDDTNTNLAYAQQNLKGTQYRYLAIG